MARSARVRSKIGCYGIVLKLDHGLRLEESDKKEFLTLLKKYKLESFKVLAYKLSSDIIYVALSDLCCEIETAMRKITVSFVKKYNDLHKHKGSVFKDRFTSIPAETYSQVWQMVFDIHSMGGETNSINSYLTDEFVDQSVCIKRFGGVFEMLAKQREWEASNHQIIMTAFSNRIKDSELYEYIHNHYNVKPTELKNLQQNDVCTILKDVICCTKASIRQIGRVTTLSLKFLWNLSKTLTGRKKVAKEVSR